MEPTRVGDVLAEMSQQIFTGEKGERLEVSRIGERVPIPNELRYAILCRDWFQCKWCWSGTELQIDHVVPWSAGGLDVPTNLRTLCKQCNQNRSNYTTDMHTAKPSPLTFDCVRCGTGGLDSTVVDAYCLRCARFTLARRDQLRLAERHVWVADMSWDEFRYRPRKRRSVLDEYLTEEFSQ